MLNRNKSHIETDVDVEFELKLFDNDASKMANVKQINLLAEKSVKQLQTSYQCEEKSYLLGYTKDMLLNAMYILETCVDGDNHNDADLRRLQARTYTNLAEIYLLKAEPKAAKSLFKLALQALQTMTLDEQTDQDGELARTLYRHQHGFFKTLKDCGLHGAPPEEQIKPPSVV